MVIFVIGGVGYIGSYICVELLNSGYEIVVFDNLFNSLVEVLNCVKEIMGKDLMFYEVDLLDWEVVDLVFVENEIEVVIYFVGLKVVGEFVVILFKYYYNNLMGMFILCEVMEKYGVKKIVFSLFVMVYGVLEMLLIMEDFLLGVINFYG